MDPKKIIIATAFIFMASHMLTGCDLIERPESAMKPAAKPIIQTAELGRKVQKDVAIQLKATQEDDQVKVTVTLDNPNKKALTSAQTWLSFDPSRLQGASVEVEGSDFEIPAPYEQTFDNLNGLVTIGRANPTPVTKSSIQVAQITFDVVEEGTTMLHVYDYRDDLTGHASANVVIDGKPYNVLKEPESPALIIQ